MDKMLMLVWWCYILAVAHAHLDLETNLLTFQRHSKQRNIEAVKDNYVKKLFTQMLGRKLSVSSNKVMLPVARQNIGLSRLEDPNADGSRSDPTVFDAMILHRELQNRLGWGSDDNSGPPKQNYGPPPPSPNQQYGPPPSQNYGPPAPPSNQNGPPPSQNYGPPAQPSNQYGPPPSQNYGPPAQPSNQYGPPPSQNYGPPAQPSNQYGPPPSQNYGPPAPPSNQYGPPPSQNYGPPAQPSNQYGPPPSQNYGPPAPPSNQYGPPPSQNYGPPAPPPSQNYGPPAPPSNQSPPSQNYGPPAPPSNQSPPSQNYGPPAPPSNQSPPSQNYGPPAPPSNNIRVNNHAMIGGHIENFKLSDAIKSNNPSDQYGPPPPPSNQYGSPPSNQYGSPPSNQYGPPSNNDISSFNNGDGGYGDDGAKIIKHVYIHTPPAETEVAQKPRVIRPNQKQDTHYQIIFVKAPTPKQQQTEIELPPQPERKTLVYLLLKKEKQSEIKIKTPPPTKPSKPEVYFIRYKGAQNGNQEGGYSSAGSTKDFGVGGSLNSEDGHYSNSYNTPSQALDGIRHLDGPQASFTSSKVRDSVGYPDTEYRAQPSMLGQEPMSIAVYDKVRNGVMPSAGNRRGSLVAAASEVSPRAVSLQHQQGSHYTAPGSKPFNFIKASGKMVAGHYVGMTSNVLKDYYSPESHKYADN